MPITTWSQNGKQVKKQKKRIEIVKLDSAVTIQTRQNDTMDKLIQAINDKEKKEVKTKPKK